MGEPSSGSSGRRGRGAEAGDSRGGDGVCGHDGRREGDGDGGGGRSARAGS